MIEAQQRAITEQQHENARQRSDVEDLREELHAVQRAVAQLTRGAAVAMRATP